MTRYALLAALAVALWTAGPASAQRPKSDPFTDALAVAQAAAPGSTLIKGRAEKTARGESVFGFYFMKDGQMREIEVNAAGQIVKDSNKTPDPISRDVAALIAAKGAARSKLPDGRLAEIAANALRGTPIADVAYFRQGDRLHVRFGTVTLDSETGQVVPPPAPAK